MESNSKTTTNEIPAGSEHVWRAKRRRRCQKSTAGFSLIEVVIALVIIMIALLGVAAVFGYTITYNAGNKSRSQALTLLQQEVERYRAAKFNAGSAPDAYTPGDPDDGRRDITGGVKAQRVVTADNGFVFLVDVTVDDDPFTDDIQIDDGATCASPQGDSVDCTIKEIAISVTLAAPSPGWRSAVPARIVLRRVRGN